VYSVPVAPEDATKPRAALTLLAEVEIHLSLQVVQEFVHLCLRKTRPGVENLALERAVRQMLAFPCYRPDGASDLRVLQVHRLHPISYRDAAI
jgi:hypothetical protein